MTPYYKANVLLCPCAKTYRKPDGQLGIDRPAVDCESDPCEQCGWNPRERERRMKTGHWVELADGSKVFKFRPAPTPKTVWAKDEVAVNG